MCFCACAPLGNNGHDSTGSHLCPCPAALAPRLSLLRATHNRNLRTSFTYFVTTPNPLSNPTLEPVCRKTRAKSLNGRPSHFYLSFPARQHSVASIEPWFGCATYDSDSHTEAEHFAEAKCAIPHAAAAACRGHLLVLRDPCETLRNSRPCLRVLRRTRCIPQRPRGHKPPGPPRNSEFARLLGPS